MSTCERSGVWGLVAFVLLCIAIGVWWFDRRSMAAQHENDLFQERIERARIKNDLVLTQDKLGRADAKIKSLETVVEGVAAEKKAAEEAKKVAEEKKAAAEKAEADAEAASSGAERKKTPPAKK